MRLSNGKFAYLQYTGTESAYENPLGYHAIVFEQVTDHPLPLAEINTSQLRFSPLFIQLKAGIKFAGWRKLGNLPVRSLPLSHYRHTPAIIGTNTGKLQGWSIVTPEGRRFVDFLNEEERKLEFYISWGYNGLDHRLVNGHFWTDDIW